MLIRPLCPRVVPQGKANLTSSIFLDEWNLTNSITPLHPLKGTHDKGDSNPLSDLWMIKDAWVCASQCPCSHSRLSIFPRPKISLLLKEHPHSALWLWIGQATRALWDLARSGLGVSWVVYNSVKNHLFTWQGLFGRKAKNKNAIFPPHAIFMSIWRETNRRAFERLDSGVASSALQI